MKCIHLDQQLLEAYPLSGFITVVGFWAYGDAVIWPCDKT